VPAAIESDTVLVNCYLDERPLRVMPIGEIDLAAGPSLARAFEVVAETATGDVLVDLSKVTFFNSTGLFFLLRLDRHVTATGYRLRIVGAARDTARLLRLTGLDRLFSRSW
jgi:anti-anti-sigma factor